MNIPAGRLSRKTIRGFSLVELLLAITLVLLMLGAVVFNFSSVQQGAELDEGATQIESLIRFAKAHAANTGRRVRMTFEEDVGDGLLVPIGNLEVTWEPDPLGFPDQFVPLPDTAPFVKTILDLVTIENVRPLTSLANAVGTSTSASSLASAEADAASANNNADPNSSLAFDTGADDPGFGFLPITFYPDGSSDSAEITLAARNEEEGAHRRIAIRLIGLTGALRRRVWKEEEGMPRVEESKPGDPAAATAGETEGAAR